jgi:hypothetical protein
MNTVKYTFASLILLLSFQLIAQTEDAVADMKFVLKQLDDNTTWGVYVVPGSSIQPSKRSNTGTGQVTIVAPVGFVYAGLENYGGTWIENARVDGPMESPESAYISFGFVTDEPRIKYQSGKETLLFTLIPEDTNIEISLFNNEDDPFATPNTYGSNPGNDLGVIDFDSDGAVIAYAYGGKMEMNANSSSKPIFVNQKAISKGNETTEFKAVFASEKVTTPSN